MNSTDLIALNLLVDLVALIIEIIREARELLRRRKKVAAARKGNGHPSSAIH